MKLTEIKPSPTAEATHLVDPERTCPAVDRPGTLVSSKQG